MASEIKLRIKVDDDGNLKAIGKKADAAAKGTKKLGTETDTLSKKRSNYNKIEKGVGQAGLSTAKGFSKQAGAISGGLVPAYAVLAANIFAITAAFNALKEAAQMKALEEGFSALGNTVGRTSSLMAEKLVEITDGAISMDAALRASASGFSAGFSMKEMEGLAEIARGASIALGRDLGDALDRLVRGTAKLEPEILDELGIFIRLDDAVDKYAQSLNTSAGSLSNAQRRQAFLNEALLQGERKFSSVMNIDTNPFDKLAAAANNLAKGFLRVVNVAVTPFINLLSSNMFALIGVLVMFANTVLSQMVPALFKLGEAQRESAEDAVKGAKAAKKEQEGKIKSQETLIRTTKTAMGEETKFAKLQQRIGTKKEKKGDREAMLKSLQRSSDMRTKTIEDKSKASTEAYIKERNEIDKLIEKLKELEDAKEGQGRLGEDLSVRKGLAKAEEGLADSMEKVNKAGALGGFKEAWKGTAKYTKEVNEVNRKNTKATGIIAGLRKHLPKLASLFTGAGAAARLFGFALINAIPIIGQILFVGGLLIQFLAKFFGKATDISKQIGVLNAITDSMGEKFEQLNEVLEKSEARQKLLNDKWEDSVEAGFRLGAEVKVLNGIIGESSEAFAALAVASDIANITTADKIKNLWHQTVNGISDLWGGLSESIGKVWEAVVANVPDLGFGEWLLGTDAEATQEILKTGFVEPLQELIDQGDSKQVAELFKSMGVDPDDPKGVERLADSMLEVAKQQVAAGKAANVNAAYTELLMGKYRKLTKASEKLVEQTVGATEVFDESSESLREFFSKEVGKDTFLTMSKDAGKLKEALAAVARNGDSTTDVLNKIKSVEGNWLRKFFGSKEDFEAAGVEEVEALLTEIEERTLAISDAQKNAALRTKDFAAQINNAKIQMKELQQAFKFNDFIKTQNVFGKSMDTAEQRAKRINVLKTVELELQKKIHADKKRQMEMEIDVQINDVKLMQMGLDKEDERYILLGEQLKLLENIKRVRGETLDTENDIANATIKQNALTKMVGANKAAVAGTQSGSMLNRVQSFGQIGNQAALIRANETEIKAAGKKEFTENMKADGWTNQGQDQWLETAGDEAGQEAFDTALKQAELQNLQNIIQGTKGLMDSLSESMKQLGPEGELVMAVQGGAFTMTESFIQLSATLDGNHSKMQEGAAIASAVASTIAATAQIMTAASNARIAAIDKEIKAEQKRDGKSKASLAKIKALEKKKETIARKAFETNKKMMMAQTVANTAAAVMGIMAADSPKLGWAVIPMAIMVAAMGAAQLAIIAGTKFEGGGGSSTSAGIPSSIAMGKRSQSSDLSKSQSARGELAYFRGERGRGGAENFKPAFTGVKHRASGGNTGYIVGEQGPELFMPDRPGTIVPSDDVSVAGGATNVTFSINAIDAAGVEDVLIQQQGNIISMLRQAANSYGEDFMEDIDETTYTTPVAAGGAQRWGS